MRFNHLYSAILLDFSFSENITSRIIGGKYAKRDEFPWMVLVANVVSYCGGSLLTPNWILSAEHCYSDLMDTTVYYGLYDKTKPEDIQFRSVAAADIHRHPQHDIALLYARNAFDIDSNENFPYLNTEILSTEKMLTALGWGATENSRELPRV